MAVEGRSPQFLLKATEKIRRIDESHLCSVIVRVAIAVNRKKYKFDENLHS
jgi:hypothetical protein